MGRRRIASEAEAMRAMDRMDAAGESVSVRTVTAALGGGSSKTIAAYVRAWRRLQDRKSAQAVQAPGALGARLAEVTDAYWAAAEAASQQEHAEREEALLEQCEALHRENEALAHEVTALRAENRMLREQLKRTKT